MAVQVFSESGETQDGGASSLKEVMDAPDAAEPGWRRFGAPRAPGREQGPWPPRACAVSQYHPGRRRWERSISGLSLPGRRLPGGPRGGRGAAETPTRGAGSLTHFSRPTKELGPLGPAVDVTPDRGRRFRVWKRNPPRPHPRPAPCGPARPIPGAARRGRRNGPASLRLGPPTSPTSGARRAVGAALAGPRSGGISHAVGAGATPYPSPLAGLGVRISPWRRRCLKGQGSPTLLRCRRPNLSGAPMGKFAVFAGPLYKKHVHLMAHMASFCPVTSV